MNDSILELAVTETEGFVFEVESLRTQLEQMTDPREPQGIRYGLVDLLTLLILAKLGGEDTVLGMAEWVKLRGAELVRLLALPRSSLPHQTTYERVLDKLDVEGFERVVGQFFSDQGKQGQVICVDGKVLRGSIPSGARQGVHLLAAYQPDAGVVLMQVEVRTDENELSAAPRLLQCLDLSGKVVTADAMFTQRDLCKQLVAAGGDYVLPVKDNQADLRQAILESFSPPPPVYGYPQASLPTQATQTLNLGHGRLEWRYLDAHPHLNNYLDWPHLAQVFRLQRLVQDSATGRLRYDVHFGITSLPDHAAPPARLLDFVRQHWHIENRLHYVRDVSFGEDACQIRNPHRQRFLAALNNLVIGLIRRCDFEFIPQARRYFAVHFQDAFQLLTS